MVVAMGEEKEQEKVSKRKRTKKWKKRRIGVEVRSWVSLRRMSCEESEMVDSYFIDIVKAFFLWLHN